MREKMVSRRHFLKTSALGSLALMSGCVGSHRLSRKQEALRLVFYTDIHAKNKGEAPHALGLAAEAINAQKPDLVIAGGDLITGGFRGTAASMAPRWRTYLEMQNRIQAEVLPALGNHDVVAARPNDGSPPGKNPKSEFCERLHVDRAFYSVDAHGYHIIFLDPIFLADNNAGYQGYIWPEQLSWLAEDLSRLPHSKPIILVTHIPLLSSLYAATKGATKPPPQSKLITNTVEVLRMFAGRNLLLVLQGHLHVHEQLWWRGVRFITGGAICGNWWQGNLHGTREGFCLLTLADNEVRCDYLNYGWHFEPKAHKSAESGGYQR